MTKIASNLQIDSARLWETIHETAKFGATPKGGVRRLTLGPADKQVRDWFREACEAAGLEVHVDTLGSMFGVRRGRDMSKAPVGLGSHLDTQPTGGKYDGVLGTLAALEVVRTLNDAGIETETPICICNWTNEEGSRFALAMETAARKHGPKAVGTIGEAIIANPSRNVIPGEIAFTVDCCSADAAVMDALDKELRAAAAEIAARREFEVALDLVWRKPPTHFD